MPVSPITKAQEEFSVLRGLVDKYDPAKSPRHLNFPGRVKNICSYCTRASGSAEEVALRILNDLEKMIKEERPFLGQKGCSQALTGFGRISLEEVTRAKASFDVKRMRCIIL